MADQSGYSLKQGLRRRIGENSQFEWQYPPNLIARGLAEQDYMAMGLAGARLERVQKVKKRVQRVVVVSGSEFKR
jgi:hypothetical protein